MIYFFFFCLAVIAYVYLGYPAILWVLTKIIGKPVKKEDITPSVTIFISAVDEEKDIEARVQNLLELDYPREKMEIFVGVDGSTDETYRIIKGLSEEKKFRYAVSFQRRGKPAMINTMAKEASGEIYVFTGARQRFERNALKELVRCFGDPEVGAVSGELLIEDKATGTGKGLGLWWEYEKALRRMESVIGSMLGATGAIYAIRHNFFVYLPENVILDGVFTPMNAIVRGHRAVFEPAARAIDVMSESSGREFSREVTAFVGNFQIFGMFKEEFDIRKSSVALRLFFHKFMRLMVPYFLIGMFIVNIFLVSQGVFFVLALILQILLYGLAILGGFLDRIGAGLIGVARFVMIPYEFCVMNFAAIVALCKYLSGEAEVKWEK